MAATKTYTAQALALAMLSAALGRRGSLDELARCPSSPRAIELQSASARAAAAREHSRLVRGPRLQPLDGPEITLKVKETTGVMADGYSSADFLHGPRAMLERSLPVLAVAPGPRASTIGPLVLAREKGAPLVAISDREDLLEQAEVAMPPARDCPNGSRRSWRSYRASSSPWASAWRAGCSPTRPPGLSKVTHTR